MHRALCQLKTGHLTSLGTRGVTSNEEDLFLCSKQEMTVLEMADGTFWLPSNGG